MLIGIFSSSAYSEQPKPEAVIKWRQLAYQVLSLNTSRIKANVEGQYNKKEVIRAANSIAAIAGSGFGTLFMTGTERGKGWPETAAKPEIFWRQKNIRELATNFIKEAKELVKVAAVGDQAAVKVQFDKLGQACESCHNDYKLQY